MMLSAFFEGIFVDDSIKLRALDDLRRKRSGNDYFAADADLTSIKTNETSFVIEGLDAEAIHAAIAAYAVEQEGGTAREIAEMSGVYIIRTPTFRFPNGLSYWIDEGEDGAARVSVYSWSVYGLRGYGINRHHVESVAKSLGISPDL